MKKNNYAEKRYKKIYNASRERDKRYLLEEFKNQLNLLSKERYTRYFYKCNCDWCLNNKLHKNKRKKIATTEQLKEVNFFDIKELLTNEI